MSCWILEAQETLNTSDAPALALGLTGLEQLRLSPTTRRLLELYGVLVQPVVLAEGLAQIHSEEGEEGLELGELASARLERLIKIMERVRMQEVSRTGGEIGFVAAQGVVVSDQTSLLFLKLVEELLTFAETSQFAGTFGLRELATLEEEGVLSAELVATISDIFTSHDLINTLEQQALTEGFVAGSSIAYQMQNLLQAEVRLVLSALTSGMMEFLGSVVERTLLVDDVQMLRLLQLNEELFVEAVMQSAFVYGTAERLSLAELAATAAEVAKTLVEGLRLGVGFSGTLGLLLSDGMSVKEVAQSVLYLVLQEPVRFVEMLAGLQEIPRELRERFDVSTANELRQTLGLSETLEVEAGLVADLIRSLYAQVELRLGGDVSVLQETLQRAVQLTRIGDQALMVLGKGLAETVTLATALGVVLRAQRLVARWLVAGESRANLEWTARVGEGIRFVEEIAQLFDLSSEEQLGLAEAVMLGLGAGARELVEIGSPASGMLFVPLTGQEQLRVSDGVVGAAELLAQARAAFLFFETLPTEPDFSGWAFNTDSMAMSQYGNFPMTSFAERANRLYGVAADGLYLLEGNDDDGAPIEALVATGDMSFQYSGTKHVPRVYLLTTAEGELYLKTITFFRKQPQEHLYKITLRDDDELGLNRVRLRREIKSEFWAFELQNVDGGDLDLQGIEVLALPSARRI